MLDSASLLKDLTPEQRQAVEHVDGPLLILAGAGSGKTRVLTRRVAYLMSLGVPGSAICAITFTNKASKEMRDRVGNVLGQPVKDIGRLGQFHPTICTFHSLCLRIIKQYGTAMGVPGAVNLLDAADQNKLIKDAIKTLDLSTTNFAPASVHGAISKAKNRLIDADTFAATANDFHSKTIGRVYRKYQELLTASNALDFDDLLLKVALGLKRDGLLAEEVARNFQYVLIDEYQDTNKAQYVIARELTRGHRNICVVGDPDQSIYGWRGADIQNILDFEADFPDALTIVLEQNYRSTKTILALASKLIDNNKQRKKKSLVTENPQGVMADVIICGDEHQEAEAVVKAFNEAREKEGLSWNDMAVFYRMNSLSRVMEDALRRGGVPYVMARGTEFYGRKEIKDVLAFLRVVANPTDAVSLERIINVPARGISDATFTALQQMAGGRGMSLFDVLADAGSVPGVSARAAAACVKFYEAVVKWQQMASANYTGGTALFTAGAGGRITRLMDQIIKQSGYEAVLQKERNANPNNDNDPLSNVNELLSSAAEYDQEFPEATLDEYLANVSLVADADRSDSADDNDVGAVSMMTLHAAKGLEFPLVAMIGLEEGILPHSRTRFNPAEMEEERRLAFVGITRAEQRLILSRAQYRTLRGMRERTVESPFIKELPQELLNIQDRTDAFGGGGGGGGRGPMASGYRGNLGAPASGFPQTSVSVGQQVRHPQFGLGRISDVAGMGQHTRVVVSFATAGVKTLILEYARLEVVAG